MKREGWCFFYSSDFLSSTFSFLRFSFLWSYILWQGILLFMTHRFGILFYFILFKNLWYYFHLFRKGFKRILFDVESIRDRFQLFLKTTPKQNIKASRALDHRNNIDFRWKSFLMEFEPIIHHNLIGTLLLGETSSKFELFWIELWRNLTHSWEEHFWKKTLSF